QVFEASVELDLRRPTKIFLRLCDVAHVVRLVALAPVCKSELRGLVRELADPFNHLEQVSLVLRSAAHVVDLATSLVDLLNPRRTGPPDLCCTRKGCENRLAGSLYRRRCSCRAFHRPCSSMQTRRALADCASAWPRAGSACRPH